MKTYTYSYQNVKSPLRPGVSPLAMIRRPYRALPRTRPGTRGATAYAPQTGP